MVKKDSQNQKINGSGGKPAQNTEQVLSVYDYNCNLLDLSCVSKDWSYMLWLKFGYM